MSGPNPVSPLPGSGAGSLPIKANAGGGDWSLQTAKWVTRAGGGDVPHENPFMGIRSLAARSAATDGPVPVGDAGEPSEAGKKLVSALDYAKCSAAAEVDESASMAMGALVDRVQGETGVAIQGNGAAAKISYKGLQISVIKGPDRPEVSVSFFGGDRAAADENLEEFVGILGDFGEGAVGNEGGRRTLTLGDTVIGLPVENPFTSGVRFKILEPSGTNRGERKVVLDSECMDALHAALSGEAGTTITGTGIGAAATADGGYGQMQQLFRPKYVAYQGYRVAAEGGEGDRKREVDRRREERAAFTLNELTQLIAFLQQRLNVNISPTATIFSAAPGAAARDIPVPDRRPVTHADVEVQSEEPAVEPYEVTLPGVEKAVEIEFDPNEFL